MGSARSKAASSATGEALRPDLYSSPPSPISHALPPPFLTFYQLSLSVFSLVLSGVYMQMLRPLFGLLKNHEEEEEE